jgi:cell division protein FtsB
MGAHNSYPVSTEFSWKCRTRCHAILSRAAGYHATSRLAELPCQTLKTRFQMQALRIVRHPIRTKPKMDNVELTILLAVLATILIVLLWLGRRLSSARTQTSDAIKLSEASLALAKEQVALQAEANLLMRELIDALRTSR